MYVCTHVCVCTSVFTLHGEKFYQGYVPLGRYMYIVGDLSKMYVLLRF